MGDQIEQKGKEPAVADAKAPEAPGAPEVKAETDKQLGKESDKQAQELTQPNDNPEGLPENSEWTDHYYELKKQLAEDPTKNGPLMGFALAALRLAAKYSKYYDMLPGVFAKSVEGSTDDGLDQEKANKLVEAHLKDKSPEQKAKDEEAAKKALADLNSQGEKPGGHVLGEGRAATKFVTSMLWGMDEFDDVRSLSTKLLKTSKGGESLYKETTMGELGKQPSIERGTLIIFAPEPLPSSKPNAMSGEKIVAYATGVGEGGDAEFKYYDLGDPNPVKTFKLSDGDSPLKATKTEILMVLKPNVEAYRDAKEEVPEGDLTDETAPEKALENSIQEIEKQNTVIETSIEEAKAMSIDPNQLNQLRDDAAKNYKLAQDTYNNQLKIKIEVSDPKVEKLNGYMKKLEELLLKAEENNKEAESLK